jgi:hypothetical protein
MPRDLEIAVVELLGVVLPDAKVHHETPPWLLRPGKAECRGRWGLMCSIYRDLTGLDLPDDMPPRERRQVDAVLELPGRPPRIFEFDESQHFNIHRATTLRAYPTDVETAFPRNAWLAASEASKKKLGTTGGWGKAKPPLFPEPGGRHLQRAFRDALADLVPAVHEWGPTLRIADFEVQGWIHGTGAEDRMVELLRTRIGIA